MGKCESASRFVQTNRNHPILSGLWTLTPSVMIRVHLMIGVTVRSSEVTWGNNPFFANNLRQDGDKNTQMVPNDLARQGDSEDMHIDLLGSWPDLDMTWTKVRFRNWQILLLTFQGQNAYDPNRLDEINTMVSFYFHVSHSKISNEKPFSQKSIIFHLMISPPNLLTLGQIWSENVTGAWKELFNACFNSS